MYEKNRFKDNLAHCFSKDPRRDFDFFLYIYLKLYVVPHGKIKSQLELYGYSV